MTKSHRRTHFWTIGIIRLSVVDSVAKSFGFLYVFWYLIHASFFSIVNFDLFSFTSAILFVFIYLFTFWRDNHFHYFVYANVYFTYFFFSFLYLLAMKMLHWFTTYALVSCDMFIDVFTRVLIIALLDIFAQVFQLNGLHAHMHQCVPKALAVQEKYLFIILSCDILIQL